MISPINSGRLARLAASTKSEVYSGLTFLKTLSVTALTTGSPYEYTHPVSPMFNGVMSNMLALLLSDTLSISGHECFKLVCGIRRAVDAHEGRRPLLRAQSV